MVAAVEDASGCMIAVPRPGPAGPPEDHRLLSGVVHHVGQRVHVVVQKLSIRTSTFILYLCGARLFSVGRLSYILAASRLTVPSRLAQLSFVASEYLSKSDVISF